MFHFNTTVYRHYLRSFVKRCSLESSQGVSKAWALSVMTRLNHSWIQSSACPSVTLFQ